MSLHCGNCGHDISAIFRMLYRCESRTDLAELTKKACALPNVAICAACLASVSPSNRSVTVPPERRGRGGRIFYACIAVSNEADIVGFNQWSEMPVLARDRFYLARSDAESLLGRAVSSIAATIIGRGAAKFEAAARAIFAAR